MLQSQKMKYRFIHPPSDALGCVICLDEVANDPWQHDKCGKLFCRECLKRVGENEPCPICRESRPRYFEDTRGKREIQELGVFCNNSDRSCDWQGTVATLKDHIDACPFTLVTCQNKCRDEDQKSRKFTRRDLPGHLENSCPNRKYKCCHCGKEGRYIKITEIHDAMCTKKPVNCTNPDCKDIVERRKLKRHREECPFTEVQCKFSTLGCAAKRMRKDMEEHELEDSSHLHMAIEAIAELREEKNQLQEQLQEQLERRVTIFKVTDYVSKSVSCDDFRSPCFYSSPGGYHMSLGVYFKNADYDNDDDYFSVYFRLERGENDRSLKWPFVGNVDVTLLNQLENKNHLSCRVRSKPSRNMQVGMELGFRKFTSHSKLMLNPAKNTQYLKNDTLYFRVSADVPDHKCWLECTVNHSTEYATGSDTTIESTSAESTTTEESSDTSSTVEDY